MESLPPEIIRQILQEVGSLSDLAPVTQVCRYLHAHATPWLYRHATIDLQYVYTQKNGVSRSEGPLPSCVAQLQGLARNSQGQCQYVQRLSVINESDFKLGQRTFLENKVGSILDERNGIQFFVNCLLEAAIPFMGCLTEFEWTVLAYPSHSIFTALSNHRLCSFTYQWPRNDFTDECGSLTLDYPSGFNPDFRVLKMENITSLSLSNIGNNKAADDTADLIFSLRNQLKILRLNPTRRWRPKMRFDRDSEEDRRVAERYDVACTFDTLFPLIYHFIVASEPQPMKLEELELHNVLDDYDFRNWIRAFNFHAIQRFTLISGRFYFDEGARNLWTYLREQNVSFKALTTDCENEPMDLFLESFEGLETLFLCDCDKRWSRLSDLSLAGHFRSLRKFFYPDCIHGSFQYSGDILRIIANCPLLEELGVYITGESMEETFAVFDEAPSLRRLYVTSCTLKEDEYIDFNDEDFLHEFFSYFGPRNSSFFNRLEVLSYYRTLWEIVPVEGDDCEREEMEYELAYEPLSDDELDALDSGREELGPEPMEIDERGSESALAPAPVPPAKAEAEDCSNDTTREEEDEMVSDPLRLLLQPKSYTWERLLSSHSRMPLRVPWINYRDDEMTRTVHEFILTKSARSARVGLRAKARTGRDDWADNSDYGLEDYLLSEEGEDEDEEGEEEEEEESREGESFEESEEGDG